MSNVVEQEQEEEVSIEIDKGIYRENGEEYFIVHDANNYNNKGDDSHSNRDDTVIMLSTMKELEKDIIAEKNKRYLDDDDDDNDHQHHHHHHHHHRGNDGNDNNSNNIHHLAMSEIEEIHNHNAHLHLEKIDPSRTSSERGRDCLLRFLDMPIMQYMGIFVLFLVVADGALFFFFLMGWQTLCRPRTDCEPRNQIYNISVQILNGLFTYMVTVSMPWRCTNFLHTVGWSCPRRSNQIGYNLYGFPSKDIWFHLPIKQRIIVLTFLLINCITQYANQVTRIIFWSYELQAYQPGSFWVNIFFITSFVTAGIGGAWMAWQLHKINIQHPGKFSPGPIALIMKYMKQCHRHCCKKKKKEKNKSDKDNEEEEEEEAMDNDNDDYQGSIQQEEPKEEEEEEEEKVEEKGGTEKEDEEEKEKGGIHDSSETSDNSKFYPDPTRFAQERVLPFSRGALRLWGA